MFNNDFYKKNEYHLTFFLLNDNCIEAILAERILEHVEISAIKIYSDSIIVIDREPYLDSKVSVENSYTHLKETYVDTQQNAQKAPESCLSFILALTNYAIKNFNNSLIWKYAKAILET